MAELNKVMMIGRLTKDPEVKYTSSGAAVAELRLAVNHTYRAKDEKREETCFIDVNLWGRSAETAKEYLSKGREIFVEGRLQQSNWETQSGEKRSKIRMVADRFQFLGGRGGDRQSMAADAGGGSSEYHGGGDTSAPDDDLPF